MNPGLLIQLHVIISILVLNFIFKDIKKRGMNQFWILLFFLGLMGLIIYFIVRKPVLSNISIKIPETCPHCKNPNNKKIRLCEWCGNQII